MTRLEILQALNRLVYESHDQEIASAARAVREQLLRRDLPPRILLLANEYFGSCSSCHRGSENPASLL